jgi:hypothetical protein
VESDKGPRECSKSTVSECLYIKISGDATTHGSERDDAQERDDEFDGSGPVDKLGCSINRFERPSSKREKRERKQFYFLDTRSSPANEIDAHPDYSPAIVTGTVTRSTLSQPFVKRNQDDLRGRNVFAG